MEINTTNSPIRPWVWQLLGLLLIAFLAITVVDKVYSVSQDFKNEVPKNTLSMSAEGKVNAKPDIASITVGVLSTGTTAKIAQDKNTESINKITDFVRQQGISDKDMVTSNLSVYPNYDYSRGTGTITGYQANQTLTMKVRGIDKSTTTVSSILVGAIEGGSNQIQGVSFGFDDPDNLKQEASKIAIEKAKQKAADLAAASGLELGKVVTISENSVSMPYPIPYAYDSVAEGRGGAAPAIESGSQDITAQMTLVFEVK